VEGIATILALTVLGGLFFPRLCAIAGLVYVIGREFYSMAYSSSGPNSRLIGTALVDVALMVQAGAAMWGGFQHAGGLGEVKAQLASLGMSV